MWWVRQTICRRRHRDRFRRGPPCREVRPRFADCRDRHPTEHPDAAGSELPCRSNDDATVAASQVVQDVARGDRSQVEHAVNDVWGRGDVWCAGDLRRHEAEQQTEEHVRHWPILVEPSRPRLYLTGDNWPRVCHSVKALPQTLVHERVTACSVAGCAPAGRLPTVHGTG